MQQKYHQRYYVNLLIYKYISCNQQGRIAIDGTKTPLTGFIDFDNHYIPNISNLYNPNVNMSLASQTKCDNMFFDTESDHIFSHFPVTYLVYIFFLSYVVIIHLLWRGEGVGIYCKLIPDWIKYTRVQILFLTQCRAGIQNQILNTTWKIISIYHRLITLTLFRFFDWNYILSL